ncbi:MAG: ABC transporter permease subunit [Clostridia bacterium]|nr:ABC transporter permease subunit [Clostridia bacterium]
MTRTATLKTEASNSLYRRKVKNKYVLFFMALPFLVLTFVFSYLPLHGWLYAFYNFRPGIPLSQTEFVGWKWFQSIAANPTQTGEVLRVLYNTVGISTMNILVSVLPVAFAIFLVEIRTEWFKKSVQVLTTIPNFISWVLVFSVAFNMFSVDSGMVNRVLMQLGLVDRGINFLATDSHIWLKMCLWNIWKTLGWSSIMYLAAIAGIDQELYEAAKVDGAGRYKMMWHITVPGILPTFFVILLLSIANFINNGFDQFYVFQNPVNRNHIEVLDLYVYNIGMVGSNFSFATAVSMLKSLISVFLLFVANGLSKLIRGESIV